MGRKGIGLELLPLPLPLLITVALILRVQVADPHELLAFHLEAALVLLALNLRCRLVRFFALSVLTTFGYLFIGNYLFVNRACGWSLGGLEPRVACSVLAAAPRTIMLLYGFAWLNSGDTEAFTRTFTRLARVFGKRSRLMPYIAGAAEYFSQLASGYDVLEYTIDCHLTARGSKLGARTRIQVTWLKLGAVIFKMFYAIPDFAYVLQSRYVRTDYMDVMPGIKRIELTTYQARPRMQSVGWNIDLADVRARYVDVSSAPTGASAALFDVLSGAVPHLRGRVEGLVELDNGENYLKWTEEMKFRISRYVGGEGSSRQLLGPTVQLEMDSSAGDPRRVAEALKYWGLEGDGRRQVEELSGGQRVRLALASAMASDCLLVLLDDVRGQLDDAARILLDEWIASDSTEGKRLFVERRAQLGSGQERDLTRSRHAGARMAREPAPLPVVIADGLHLVRGGRTLLTEWSHSFEPGTITVMTGPNGSGKTSLALALIGALEPTRGHVARAAPIGMSFQTVREQILRFTAAEELAVRPGLSTTDQSAYASYIQDGLDNIGLNASSETVGLGAGQLRGLSIRAMMFKTGFLILDEPSNGLTGAELKDLVHTIEALREQGIAILVITHDPSIWNADAVVALGTS